MAPPFALPPPDFPLPAYVRQAESRLLVPNEKIRKAVLPGLITPPAFFSASKPEFDISYISSNSAFNVSNRTFFGQNIGDPAPGRLVVIEVAFADGAGDVSSVNVGGTAATFVTRNSGQNSQIELWYAKHPSGSTANIQVSLSSVNARLHINVLRLVGQSTDEPVDTATSSGGNDSNRSLSIDAPEGGGIIVGAYSTDFNQNYVNATKLHELTYSDNDAVSCGRYLTTGVSQINRIISVNPSRCIIAAAWA